MAGFTAVVLVILISTWVYITCSRRMIDYAKKEARLPDAVRYEDLKARLEEVQARYEEARESLIEARQVIDEAEQSRRELEMTKAELAGLEEDRREFERLQAELTRVREEQAQLLEQVRAAQTEKEKCAFEASLLERKKEDLAEQVRALEERREAEERRYNEARGAYEQKREELAQVSSQLTSLRSELAAVNAELEEKRRKLNQLAQQAENYRVARNQLGEEIEKLKQKKVRLGSESERLSQEYESLLSHLKDLRAESVKRDPLVGEGEASLEELTQPALKKGEFSGKAGRFPEHEALERVFSYLGRLGLQFARRTVLAFHTSLKVAMDTPLVVLAGISGTGKSLLPRRYAEAMGMHFLNVPVQPRWDGPQDLLGFFNYLENRYKATPLLRALLQFDPVGSSRPGLDIEQPLSDRMLLVLFDEMNLARIEYYFSEFLSCLEIRRDVRDVNDEKDRRKAEIVLDVGSFTQDKDLRLYVDTNVLFAGTMNEDESTLSLSDKVIDRANVLRFGRPPNLSLDGIQEDDGAERFRPKKFLPKAVWAKWIEEGEKQKITRDVDDKIEKLNEALDYVGRPFGFRTRNAIRSYVRQYPDKSEIGTRNALGDQIEQRILPKLRGLDLTEGPAEKALNLVVDVVEDLRDEALLEAIERGKEAYGGHVFTWFGAQREVEA